MDKGLFTQALAKFFLDVIAKRIINEEKVLEEGLQGYADYKKKVKYRILPYIW